MKNFLKNVLFLAIFLFITVGIIISIYNRKGYGSFKKSLSRPENAYFTRDEKVKYSNTNSYKIENKDYNNSTFYKNIRVKKNTPYRISCMVKTEDVSILDKSNKSSGAKISILNSTEQSETIVGTNDWRRISLVVNSKQNEELYVGFMLGAETEYGNVKGTAWFSNFEIEEGIQKPTDTWNFACFVFKNIDVTIEKTRYKISMTNRDVSQIKNCMARFQTTCPELSNNMMGVNYDVIEIDEPVKKLTYDKDRGFYIDANDVSNVLDKYMGEKEYNHIFVCARFNDDKLSIKCNNWIGLGGMEYKGIGFSNIRMPTKLNSNIYVYNEYANKFPEEVFVHEFLHTLEKNSEKYGYQVPRLHDYKNYGYEEDKAEGLYAWFKAYMTATIGNEGYGLNKNIYKIKPMNEKNFLHYARLDEFNDA